MINLNQLRVFYEAAISLNFSAAARNLNVTQPAITNQVRAFEEICGFKLFRKSKGKISLTDQGKTVFKHASKLFEYQKELEETVQDLRKSKQGHLRVGTTKTYARYFMPMLLANFHRSYPGIVIDLNEGSSLDICRSLLDYRNAFAIVAKIREIVDVVFKPLLREEVLLVTSPRHDLAEMTDISFSELARVPLIIKESGSGTRKLILERASSENIDLDIIMQTSNMDFIKELVKQNQAISFMVRSSVERELSSGELRAVPVHGGPFLLDVYLAYLRDQDQPAPMKAFLEFLDPLLEPDRLPVGAAALMGRFSSLG